MRVATLGPEGTCSEEVTLAYLQHHGLAPTESLFLRETFEQAIQMVLDGEVEQAVVPAAYIGFHKLVYNNVGYLRVREVLYSKTPAFVLCARSQIRLAPEGHQYRIAS